MAFFRTTTALLALLCAQAVLAAERLPLKWCYEDVATPPWTEPDARGLNFDLLRRVEKKLGEHFVYSSRPWKRCLEEVRHGDFDGVFAAAESEDRRAYGTYPTLPNGQSDPSRALHTEEFYVFLRNGGPASWDGQQLQASAKGVLVQRGYVVASLLREKGFDVRESASTAHDALRQLAAGMFDVSVLQGTAPERLLRSDTALSAKVVKAAVPYAVLPMYLMAATPAFERDPQRFEAIWAAIANERKSAQYRKQEAQALRGMKVE